jgi:hypothetical protein
MGAFGWLVAEKDEEENFENFYFIKHHYLSSQ